MKKKAYRARRGTVSLQTPYFHAVTIPLAEQPRPQFARRDPIILNGEWDYAIRQQGEAIGSYDGKIMVPFSPESAASGVLRVLEPGQVLYYRRTLSLAAVSPHFLLHFDAVDHEATLTVNGHYVGCHRGGYLPFSFDIAPYLAAGENEICLAVLDATDTTDQARGKQTLHPGGIWYTPQSGIWQTVWAEALPDVYIPSAKMTPDLEHHCIHFSFPIPGVSVLIQDGAHRYFAIAQGKELSITLPSPHPWTPDDPYLYPVTFSLGEDRVESYFAMRKFSIMTDSDGKKRLALNDRPIFHHGVLDQGYYPESLLTPPSDEAMVADILAVKALGMNMLRKHIKIEPMRFYYHCDRLGILVWQDIVSGGADYAFPIICALPFIGLHIKDTGRIGHRLFRRTSAAGRAAFIAMAEETVSHLYNVPSLSLYTLFNEGWGQFDSRALGTHMMQLDSTRIWDVISGWHDQGKDSTPLKSLHVYYKKVRLPKKEGRCLVLSEFGGYSCPVDGHMFSPDRLFGYRMYHSQDTLREAIVQLYQNEVFPLVKEGLSAAVYTQLSDVEEEINGILTYDRRVNKLEGLDLSYTE